MKYDGVGDIGGLIILCFFIGLQIAHITKILGIR